MFRNPFNKALLVCAALLLASLALSQAATTFTIGGTGLDYGYGMTAGPDGHVYGVGVTDSNLPGFTSHGEWDAVLFKLTAEGELVWAQQYGTEGTESARDVAVTADGAVYVVGQTSGDLGGPNYGDLDAYLARFSADGELEWARQFGTPAEEYAYHVEVDHAGRIIVAGTTWGSMAESSGSGRNVFVAAFDGAGEQLWLVQHGISFNSEHNDSVHDMAIGPDGYIYLATSGGVPQVLEPGTAASDYGFMIVLDAVNGERLNSIFGPPASRQAWRSQNRALAFDAEGSLYMLGQFAEVGVGGGQWFLVRFQPPVYENGKHELELDYIVPFRLTAWELVAMDLVVDHQGRPLALGVSPTGPTRADLWGSFVFALEVNGDEVSSVYSSIVENATGQDVVVGPNGRLYVTGTLEAADEATPQYDILVTLLPE